MENWQVELLKILGAVLFAFVTYCLGRRDYKFRRAAERTELQENADLLLKYSDLHSTLQDKGQTIGQLAELIKAGQQIDHLAKGNSDDQELGKLVASLIDDQVQELLELCILSEEYMRLSDQFKQPVSEYLLARYDLERMLLYLAIIILDAAPEEWGFPRDPVGALAQYFDYLKTQLEKDQLGHLAIEFSEAVSWKREDMQEYVSNLLGTLRNPESIRPDC